MGNGTAVDIGLMVCVILLAWNSGYVLHRRKAFRGASPPVNTCNSCSPAIPDILYAQSSGCSGDFAYADTKRQLDWTSGCNWVFSSGSAQITLAYSSPNWSIEVENTDPDNCWRWWYKADAGGCTPHGGSYLYSACVDSSCNDTDSCEDSTGASIAITAS